MKRQRPPSMEYVQVVRKKPRIDKQIVVVRNTVSTTQVSTPIWQNLYTPCNIAGFRWDLSGYATTTDPSHMAWAIVRVPQGTTPSTLSLTNQATLYAPEHEVITYGTFSMTDTDGGTGNTTFSASGAVKTTRNFDVGDILYFVSIGTVANMASLLGSIQFFLKV